MKKTITKSLFLIASSMLIWYACEKEPEPPDNINKISFFEETTTDTVSYRSVSITCNIKDIGDKDITQYGFCWDTAENPDITKDTLLLGSLSDKGSISGELTGLTPGTIYYVRGFIQFAGITVYTTQDTITTLALTAPSIITTEATGITDSTAVVGGEIKHNGGAEVTEKGICYAKHTAPSFTDTVLKDTISKEQFSIQLTGLQYKTTYYVRFYAINSIDTAYGNEISFTTIITTPNVITEPVTNIMTTSATSGGNVTNNGGEIVTARGVCWSTSTNPTTADNKTISGSGTGNFVSNLSGLSLNTTYYLRAYATNSKGTAYGNEINFTTGDGIITITTKPITDITTTSATSGGDITDNGGATVTSRGVCWSTSSNPTISDNTTSDGNGRGSYNSSITGLSIANTYYVRAYATNSYGTYYGNEESFSTNCPATVTDYDGNTYDVVRIGNQCWMAENLKVTHYAVGTAIPHVSGDTEWDNLTETDKAWCYYDNSSSNGDTYGALYTWAAAMNGAASSNSNPSGVQGVCPDGWHLPGDTEWEQLAEYISNDNGGYTKDVDDWNNVGGHLKATSGWDSGGNGTDDYGFFGLPGGFRNFDANYLQIGCVGRWWSGTENNPNRSWSRYLGCNSESEYFGRYDGNKKVGFSVRCLRDFTP